jgi:hypothetical protein
MPSDVTTALYHVMFDGKPEVRVHVCPACRAFADLLTCSDEKDERGQCSHVQYADCHCPASRWGCFVCRNHVL